MIDEGYIKYESHWTAGPATHIEASRELDNWRRPLFEAGLIGQYEDIGIGYGNISMRRGTSGLFLISGEATVADETLRRGELAVLQDNATATVHATADSHVMVCGGAALPGERIVWWNFVNSSRARIEQAKQDWREGRFPDVPGEEDFIPLPKA